MGASKTKRSRYTRPPTKKKPPSPLWIPVTVFALLLAGTLIVIVNYLGVLPGDQQNRYLFFGLAEITAGFVMATRFR